MNNSNNTTKQCVVRTYSGLSKMEPMAELVAKLNDGWNVKICTPMISPVNYDYIEYILEKED